MGHLSNIKIVKVSRMLESMTVNNDDIIIDNDFNFSINGLDNKSLENEKKNESINMSIII